MTEKKVLGVLPAGDFVVAHVDRDGNVWREPLVGRAVIVDDLYEDEGRVVWTSAEPIRWLAGEQVSELDFKSEGNPLVVPNDWDEDFIREVVLSHMEGTDPAFVEAVKAAIAEAPS